MQKGLLTGNSDYLRHKSDDKMDQYAAPNGLVFLVKISCKSTKDSSSEHHGKFISHVEHEEE